MRFRFALISDAHLGPPTRHAGKLRKLGDDAEPLTQAFVDALQGPRPDLVVNLGDVVEDESPEADRARYARFLEILGGAGLPLLNVAGNHDTVHLDDATLARLWGHDGPLHYARDVGPFRFVVLHSVQGARSVELPDTQIAWLDETLASSPRPVVVLVHHPLSDQELTGNPWFEEQPHVCRVSNRRGVRDVLHRSGNVVAVFNGHVHWNHLDVIHGVPYVTVQSLIENVEDDAPGRAAAAWAHVEVSRQRMHVLVRGEQPVRYQIELPRPLDAWP
jgi:3',5'-cyclic AMP phosphodiesterase CpdA